ncbi:MAG: prepilin-type N-terminal cleavage/methylation domain-containing protein, partial [Planctomycetales bacterium]|nr:prepilin-type N-terminal cleavage/methylation domain-containing protein [Planctomycetales bacterium]
MTLVELLVVIAI